MALMMPQEKVAPSEFTGNYYDVPKTIDGSDLLLPKKGRRLQVPAVPPLLPKDVGGSWSAPPRINPAIWRASHQTKLQQAKSATSFSQRQREENRRLREEVRNLTESNLATVNHRLETRLSDVDFWKKELDKRHQELCSDAEHLKEIKDRLMKQHERLYHPLQVAEKCVQIRNERIGVENVEDEASTALRQEIEEVHHSRTALERTIADTKEQVLISHVSVQSMEELRKVLSCLYHLETNVIDKDRSFKVDQKVSELSRLESLSDVIPSQHLDPSPLSVDDWRENSLALAQRAENEHDMSTQIASTGEAMLAVSARQVEEAIRRTNEALRRRIDDTRNTKNMLEAEHAKVVEEASELKASIAELEDELEGKREPLAIAQTRLKTRLQRPIREKTRDEVEAALLKEVSELEMTSHRLRKALDLSRRNLQSVSSSKFALEFDINLKTKTLYLDEVEILGLRSTIDIGSC